MQLRFKLIIVLIFLALISVFLYQFNMLTRFYKGQSSQLEVNILSAMKDADNKNRNWKPDESNLPDFNRYNDLVQIELVQKGIDIEFFIEQLDWINKKVLATAPENLSNINKAEYKNFTYVFDADGKYAYRMYIKQPDRYIFKQMQGILWTSLLMIFFLFISYIYLLRIIYRQKNIDQIKTDFVNNITHELKTPISITYAAADALQNYGIIDDKIKREEYLNLSKQQLMHLNSLVEQILTMAVEERKNLKLSLEEIRLYELFQELKGQTILNATKTVDIQIDVIPENLTIQADKVHFRNVINNLIENSIKYSHDQVNIILSARRQKDAVCIQVSDNGIGIPSSSIPKLYDRFYRVPTGNIHEVKGYGLGLYYVKNIVEKHKGTIKVESKWGEGTTFSIYIP